MVECSQHRVRCVCLCVFRSRDEVVASVAPPGGWDGYGLRLPGSDDDDDDEEEGDKTSGGGSGSGGGTADAATGGDGDGDGDADSVTVC